MYTCMCVCAQLVPVTQHFCWNSNWNCWQRMLIEPCNQPTNHHSNQPAGEENPLRCRRWHNTQANALIKILPKISRECGSFECMQVTVIVRLKFCQQTSITHTPTHVWSSNCNHNCEKGAERERERSLFGQTCVVIIGGLLLNYDSWLVMGWNF